MNEELEMIWKEWYGLIEVLPRNIPAETEENCEINRIASVPRSVEGAPSEYKSRTLLQIYQSVRLLTQGGTTG
jgi:hypothetical protein